MSTLRCVVAYITVRSCATFEYGLRDIIALWIHHTTNSLEVTEYLGVRLAFLFLNPKTSGSNFTYLDKFHNFPQAFQVNAAIVLQDMPRLPLSKSLQSHDL
jgi:hypothetical protein